jgi:glucosamine--fructose-6-phosphate aminotransferase (isomerizing)
MVSTSEFTAAEILDKLKNLEYRGYDSFGYASHDAVRRDVGRITTTGEDAATTMRCGIAHTRWATHGNATVSNAHPHIVGRVRLVHNGIIENYDELAQGVQFSSETDSERIAGAIHEQMERHPPLEAIREALAKAKGTWAIAMLVEGEDGLFVARNKAPLIIGRTGEGYVVSSDARGLAEAQEVSVIADGTIAHITADAITAIDGAGSGRELMWEENLVEAGSGRSPGYAMEQEILETPAVIARVRESWQHTAAQTRTAAQGRITVVACGSSYHAALLARSLAGAEDRVEVQLASESEVRTPAVLAVSQSGETADVLDALERARSDRAHCDRAIAVVNTPHSTLTKMARHTFLLRAGEERSVAATKSFTAQVLMLSALFGRELFDDALAGAQEALAAREEIRRAAAELQHAEHIFILGRRSHYALAQEFALKLKEIAYQHAEAVPALELKHGPLALISDNVPVIVLGSSDDARIASTMHEVAARGGKVVPWYLGGDPKDIFRALVAAQLLTFEIALARGLPIDMPRNLAKSVTVF